jgi:hypothetical protein
MGIIGRNPVDGVTRPKFKHKDIKIFINAQYAIKG